MAVSKRFIEDPSRLETISEQKISKILLSYELHETLGSDDFDLHMLAARASSSLIVRGGTYFSRASQAKLLGVHYNLDSLAGRVAASHLLTGWLRSRRGIISKGSFKNGAEGEIGRAVIIATKGDSKGQIIVDSALDDYAGNEKRYLGLTWNDITPLILEAGISPKDKNQIDAYMFQNYPGIIGIEGVISWAFSRVIRAPEVSYLHQRTQDTSTDIAEVLAAMKAQACIATISSMTADIEMRDVSDFYTVRI